MKRFFINIKRDMDHEMNIEFSSAEGNGVINKSADGSYFEVNLDEALHVPYNAYNVKLSIETASLWWTMVNIDENNNKFYITVDAGAQEVYELENGLYDHKSLE